MIIRFLFISFGMLFVKLAYGEKGMEARETVGRPGTGWAFLWTMLLYIWFPVTILYLMTGEFTVLYTVGILLLFPIPYLLFFIGARRSLPALLKEAEAVEEAIRLEEEKQREKKYGQWYADLDY